jgi:hypothetical protein
VNDDDMTRLYPYTTADLEKVRPSMVRVGDLLALWGPQGSGRLSGNVVVEACYGGMSGMGGEKYLITYRQATSGRDLTNHQPESIPVWRVRKDRIQGRVA